MKPTTLYYYAFLGLVLCLQLLHTVFSLSQNIGYGQKISLLEKRKAALNQEILQQQAAQAKQLALRELSQEEAALYHNITQVILVERSNTSLASR